MSNLKLANERPTDAEIRDRRLKLAEAGVVFVLVLGVCIFLGIYFARQPIDEPIAVNAPLDVPPAAYISPLPADPAPATTSGGTEPAGVVASEISAASGHTPDVREILPNVALYATYASAEQTYFAGRYQEAADMFAVYCERHPANAWGHYMRGLSLWKAGQNEAARQALTAALALQPDHLKSLVNLARVELALAAPDAALAAIEQALDIAPQHVDALRVLGRTYHQLQHPDQAAVAYVRALRLQPDDPWTLNNLALISIEQEQFAAALGPLARAAELAPTVAVIRNNLGTVLERTGHWAQAREQYLLAAELGSGRAEDSYARLEAVVVPPEEMIVDLAAVAAAWTVPAGADDQGLFDRAVAAVAPEAAPADHEH